MYRQILRQLIGCVCTLAVVAVFVFVLMRVIPGDPVDVLAAEGGLPEDVVAVIRREMGLHLPLHLQFVHWVEHALQGNLGVSLRSSLPVAWLIAQSIPRTVSLAVTGLLIGITLAVPISLLAAAKPGSWFDWLANTWSIVTSAVPGFAIGLAALLIFAVKLRWVPATAHLLLPACVLGFDVAGLLIRTLTTSLREERGKDYVRTALASGLSLWQALFRHVLPNSLMTTLTVATLAFADVLTGATILETLFSWPGLGMLVVDAIKGRDYPLVQAVVLLMAATFILVNFATDLLYKVIDPRIRTDGPA